MAGLMIGLSCRNNSLSPSDIVLICEKIVIKVLILGGNKEKNWVFLKENRIRYLSGMCYNKIVPNRSVGKKCQKEVSERGRCREGGSFPLHKEQISHRSGIPVAPVPGLRGFPPSG